MIYKMTNNQNRNGEWEKVGEGQKLSFSSIFDAQITTLIAGLIMYWWGNGAVKGFADCCRAECEGKCKSESMKG